MGKRDKYIDWLTTFILFLIPVILTYQESIIQFVPKEYLYIVSGIFAILSQIGTEGRVQSVKEKYKQIENWTLNDILVLETLKSKQIITQTQFDEKKDELLGL